MPINEWTHLACVYKNHQSVLYKNGEYVGTYNVATDFDSDATNTCIGRETYANGYFGFNGRINDIRLYDHCLSLKEIKEISRGLILHYTLSNSGENLYKGSYDFSGGSWVNASGWTTENEKYSDFTVKSKSTVWGGISQNIPCSNSDIFTISFYAKVQSGGTIMSIHRSSLGNVTTGLNILGGNFVSGTDWVTSSKDGTQWRWYWATVQITSSDITYLQWRIENSVSNKTLYLCGIKLERGAVPTPWIPNTTDPLYSTMGLDNNIEYDVSGYRRDGTKNNITSSPDTVRYNTSSVFNGSNSYIKTDSNDWMVQYASEMTVNVWACCNTWNSNTHLFSCTESGGFNTEVGNSGYLRVPIYVATNAEHTAHAYKYDSQEFKISDLSAGWHMFTVVYDSTGTKTFIDGVLHHTTSFVSYGIRYNTNARLFLGCEANGANPSAPYLNGKESDFRLYYTALSADDILELYHAPISITNSGILMTQGELWEV